MPLGEKKLRVLIEIASRLLELREPGAVLDDVLAQAVRALKAERGFLLLRTGGRKVVRVAGWSEEAAARYSSSAVERVLQTGEPVWIHDALTDASLGRPSSVLLDQIRSILAVPLVLEDKPVGVIYVDSTSRSGLFRAEDLEFLKEFARIASLAIRNARLYERLMEENRRLQARGEIARVLVGESPPMRKVADLILRFAPSSAPVLITGESGTGKELAARLIHRFSRRKGPFIPVHLGAIPRDLLESELFGYAKGAFTGAVRDRKGLFEEAQGGTLFLDEVAEIPPEVQVKLLRALQEGEIRRIGENRPIAVDVRIVAATNKVLEEEVQAGRFREDLYYRLNVLRLHLPPLRERLEDIPLLAEHFLRKYREVEGKPLEGFTKEALEKLQRHTWPGNVRELENVVRRAVILATPPLIRAEDLIFEGMKAEEAKAPEGWLPLEEMELRYVLRVLESVNWNKARAAQILGITPRGLRYKLQRWGIQT